jgi:hypothetical protein
LGECTIDTVKHLPSGTDSRNRTRRSGSRLPSTKRVAVATSGLSSTELLAKIDALDWDETVSPEPVDLAADRSNIQYPDHAASSWRVAGIVVLIVAALAILYVILKPGVPSVQPGAETDPALVAAAEPPMVIAANSGEARIAEVTAAEARRTAMYEQAAQNAEAKAQRIAERQRKAREAKAAQHERERLQQEEARIAAEKAAAEAAARAAKAREVAAQPKAPASPQELCASAGNIFARGFCESKACSQPEWRNHPFCVKRLSDQLRAVGQGQ